jgi:hypothetical protein
LGQSLKQLIGTQHDLRQFRQRVQKPSGMPGIMAAFVTKNRLSWLMAEGTRQASA